MAEALNIQLYFALVKESVSPPATTAGTPTAALPSLVAATADQAWVISPGRGGLLLPAQAGVLDCGSADLGPGSAARTPRSGLGSAAQRQLDCEQGQQVLNLSAQQQRQRLELIEQQRQTLQVGPGTPFMRQGRGLRFACGCQAQQKLHTMQG